MAGWLQLQPPIVCLLLDFLLTLRLSGRLAVGYLLGKVLQALLHPYTFPPELGHHQKLGHALPADFLRQSIVAIYLRGT